MIARVRRSTRISPRLLQAHAAELWREFRADMHGADYSRWLYNGWNKKALGDKPPDLGYWMGYQISKAYYERASNKRQAIREILSIKDFDRFVAESGYAGVPSLTTSVIVSSSQRASRRDPRPRYRPT
jgi:hypothetical protein